MSNHVTIGEEPQMGLEKFVQLHEELDLLISKKIQKRIKKHRDLPVVRKSIYVSRDGNGDNTFEYFVEYYGPGDVLVGESKYSSDELKDEGKRD
jgi:hypothetical protein